VSVTLRTLDVEVYRHEENFGCMYSASKTVPLGEVIEKVNVENT
jgi:hypothetical protein